MLLMRSRDADRFIPKQDHHSHRAEDARVDSMPRCERAAQHGFERPGRSRSSATRYDTLLPVGRSRNEEIESLPTLDQLVLHYQPIVEFASERIVGFEALVRWQHPERGLLYPDSFLPLAEETGFIAEIDQWVCEHSIDQLADWQRKFVSAPASG